MNVCLESDIGECDGLIISGYFPHIRLMSYMKPNISFIGFSSTWYEQTDCGDFEENHIINYLHEKSDTIAFSSYYLVDNKKLYECGTTFEEFLNKKFLIKFANKTLLHEESGIVINDTFNKYIERIVTEVLENKYEYSCKKCI